MSGKPLQPCLVIHRRDYRNSSLLLELFTLDEGRMPAIARGAKSGRAPRAALLQPFTPLQVSFSGKGEIKTLGQVEPEGQVFSLNGKRLYCGFYLNELLMRLLQRNDPHQQLFAHYVTVLSALANGASIDECLRDFEVKLLRELGYALLLDRECETHTPVVADKLYAYVIEQGPLESPQHDSAVSVDVHGRTLLCLQHGLAMDRTTRLEAKALMRRILAFYLGDKPLKSRELFRGFVQPE
ncbi:MAG: DNA repair protein RecO [Gammaproteobacteria bacterium]|nr:DNA repair protein RecO [Gammaproteobacteria bacterium]